MLLLASTKEIAYRQLRVLMLITVACIAFNQNLTAWMVLVSGCYGLLLAWETRKDLRYQVLPHNLQWGMVLLFLLSYFSLHYVAKEHVWACTYNFIYVVGQYFIVVWLCERFPGLHLPNWQIASWDESKKRLTIHRLAKLAMYTSNPETKTANAIEVKGLHLALLPWWKRWEHWAFPLQLLSVVGIVGIFVVLLGIAQHFMQIPLGGDWIDPEANPLLKTRVYSTWENPNILAGYLCMLGAYLMAFIRNLKNKKWRWAFFAYLLATLLCLVYTYSRGFWGAMFLEILCFVIFFYHHGFYYLIGGLILGAVVAGPAVQQRLLTITSVHDTSTELRLAYVEIATDIIKDHPLGIGWNNYQFVFPDYDFFLKDPTVIMYHCHNLLLNITAEMGILGLVFFLFVWFLALKMAWQLHKKAFRSWQKSVGLGYILMSLGVLAGGMTDHVLFNVRLGVLFWLLTILIVVVRKYASLERGPEL
jgi:putative inorganic carbon (HCO3(-)) transporter